ncbi:MAG TPA: T9SS type A sorting domain-containing protein [Flavobacteriales bacterium]|nr:T9SS type A sorting domain-containing protein [Flavobacteriales bacterium]
MKQPVLLSAFTAAALLLSAGANAQIIYTDVDPDLTITQSDIGSTAHALDINNDGLTDATLTANRTSSFNSVFLGTSNGSQVLMCCPILLTKAMNGGVFVGADASGTGGSWTNDPQGRLRQVPTSGGGGHGGWGGNPIPFGDWSNPTDRYLAIRFPVGGDWYYGWVRVSVSSGANSFTIRDYAYNGVPGEGILAGDMGSISTGIASSALLGMQVSPNPFTTALNIALPTGTTGTVLCRVLSLTGQAVITRTVAATSGPSTITLDLASLAPGTYLLEMQVDGERIVRKVVKE